MSKPVNLNRFRKERQRAEKKARADQNSTLYGLGKAHKTLIKSEQTLIDERLNDSQRDTTTAPKTPK